LSLTSVHKVSVVLPAGSYDEASRQQASARHWARHQLPRLLERHTAQLAPDDEVVYIEKVTIELNDLPWNLSDAAWQDKLAAAIRVHAKTVDPFEPIVRQWLFYLAQGCLEKDALLADKRAIESYLLKRLDKLPSVLRHALHAGVTMAMWQRLIAQHSMPLVKQFIMIVLAVESSEAVRLYEVLKPAIEVEPELVYRLLRAAERGNTTNSISEKRALMDRLVQAKPGALQEIEKLRELVSKEATGRVRNDLPDASIACAHAGLVLLFPYLKRYFENSGLVEGDAFVDDGARYKAVQALHFLATGATGVGEPAVQEETLVLPKVLCGMDLATFVEWPEELPEQLQKEGIELLQAVIDHWKTLQNTSIDALRETFLQRAGRLSIKNDTYTLQVEESGVDILLNSIPWGFRNYRLPWMPGHLFTEWY